MKIYKTKKGILINKNEDFYLLDIQDWDSFINDDQLAEKLKRLVSGSPKLTQPQDYLKDQILAPIGRQEVWASGVTYFNSKLGREEESKQAGGSDFYARVYEAARPELFFKATPERTVGHMEKVRIRKDSSWDVPEPELTLLISSSGKILGYTIGNDMSSRSIEGENPLYLPQAKTYDGCASLGPCILVTEQPLPKNTTISLEILRAGETVFKGEVAISQIKREFTDLAAYLYRECSFPFGSFLMTGTGIVPSSDFSLKQADEIHIAIDGIGKLVNTVA